MKHMNQEKHYPPEKSVLKIRKETDYGMYHPDSSVKVKNCKKCSAFFEYSKKKSQHLSYVERNLCVGCRAKDKMKDIC